MKTDYIKPSSINLPIDGVERPTVSEVCKTLSSSSEGLTAGQVVERQKKYGKNLIQEQKETTILRKFLSNFTSLMAILLWIGGLIALISNMLVLGISIWLVNIINGTFSFWQEFQANKATEALKKMLPSYTRVIRQGQEKKILSEDLVPGDLMLIEEGEKISADARLISSVNLQVNQSTLTGESNPVRKTSDTISKKDLTRFESPNLLFAGTSVSSGSGEAIVTQIGMDSEFGKIAGLTQNMTEAPSPLQKELNKLTKQISAIAVSIGVAFFLAAWLFVKDPLIESFIFALGMIVAFIPEGLLPTVTLSLAKAVQRAAQSHALIKRLSAVETLGSTSVICSDKTGTLTQNEMTVNALWLPGRQLVVTGIGYSPEGELHELEKDKAIKAETDPDLKQMLCGAYLCSNARVLPPNKDNSDRYTVLGDPTEACLGVAAQKAGLDLCEISRNYPRLRELPFDSCRKRMTTIHTPEKRDAIDAKRIAFTKGAPKEVLELCGTYKQNGSLVPIADDFRKEVMEKNDSYARDGLRVLAVACRLIRADSDLPPNLSAYTPESVEQDLTFLGLIAMADPPRPEVSSAVELCHRASIRIIMITGDYGLTAESIAKRIGIVRSAHPRIITGRELETMDDTALKQALTDEIIFARMAPEQKYRVVTALQEMGNIVAVTGDGVNDAPALKKADIGVAMGITGTDVAKEAADMILTDDNFASIVGAVKEGRAVYSNIQKFLLYILNSNVPEAVPSAFFLFSRGLIPLPLTVLQILSVDLGTDMLPALGLGVEPPEHGLMDVPPRDPHSQLLNKNIFIKAFLWYGALAAIICMSAFFFTYFINGWHLGSAIASSGLIYQQATTMSLGAIIFCQIGAVMNCRTKSESVFSVGLFSNRRVLIGIIAELAIYCALMFIPFLQPIFNTAPIPWQGWLLLVCVPFIPFVLEEIRKALLRKRQ